MQQKDRLIVTAAVFGGILFLAGLFSGLWLNRRPPGYPAPDPRSLLLTPAPNGPPQPGSTLNIILPCGHRALTMNTFGGISMAMCEHGHSWHYIDGQWRDPGALPDFR